MFQRIDDRTLVSGQLYPADVAAAAEAGVRLIVNNRPDNEQAGQPSGEEIEEAAHALGIQYRFIPISGAFSPEQIAAMNDAIDSAQGSLLAYCAVGTRSIYLWALARAEAGEDGDAIVAKAAAAGFDLSPLRPHLG